MVGTQIYNFNIKTVSPIHIGSGSSYNASDYFRDKHKTIDIFKRVNLSKYYKSLDVYEQKKLVKQLQNSDFRLKKISDEYKMYTAYDRCVKKPNPSNLIHENIKTLNKSYIPGSSLKGAIRTALFYNNLTHEDINKIIKNNGEINEKFLNNFFSPTGNANDNILRFLYLKDSSIFPNPAIYDIITIKPDKLNGKKNIVKTYLETIFSQKKTLSSSIIINYKNGFYNELNFENKEIFMDIDYIKKSIYEFSKDYINNEIKFSKENDLNSLNKFYKKIKGMNNVDSPLMKIGSSSGFLATTLNLKIKNMDRVVYNKIKMKVPGKKSKLDFPITRKIVNKTDEPPGWVKLIF